MTNEEFAENLTDYLCYPNIRVWIDMSAEELETKIKDYLIKNSLCITVCEYNV